MHKLEEINYNINCNISKTLKKLNQVKQTKLIIKFLICPGAYGSKLTIYFSILFHN